MQLSRLLILPLASLVVAQLREEKTLRALGSNIEWTLQCADCPKVEDALGLMARILENVLVLKRLRIHVVYEPCPGCDVQNATDCRSTQHLVREDGAYFLYPQALLKQRDPAEHWEDYDMTISFKAMHHYFPADFGSEMLSHQVSFMDELIQQVSHGLGMFSMLQMHLPRLLTPYPFHDTEGRGHLHFFFGAFDKHLAFKSPNTSLVALAQQLDRLGPIANVTLVDDGSFIPSHPHHDIFRTMATLLRDPANLHFHTDTRDVAVDSFVSPHIEGFSHSDFYAFDEPRETLAIYKRLAKKETRSFQREGHWATSPFDEDALLVLATLGYPRNPRPRHEHSLEYYFQQRQSWLQKLMGFLKNLLMSH